MKYLTRDIGPYKKGTEINLQNIGEYTVITWEVLGWLSDTEPGKWEPEVDGQYYYIDSEGEAERSTCNGDRIDNDRKNFLGVYPTEEAAEDAREKIREFVKGMK